VATADGQTKLTEEAHSMQCRNNQQAVRVMELEFSLAGLHGTVSGAPSLSLDTGVTCSLFPQFPRLQADKVSVMQHLQYGMKSLLKSATALPWLLLKSTLRHIILPELR